MKRRVIQADKACNVHGSMFYRLLSYNWRELSTFMEEEKSLISRNTQKITPFILKHPWPDSESISSAHELQNSFAQVRKMIFDNSTWEKLQIRFCRKTLNSQKCFDSSCMLVEEHIDFEIYLYVQLKMYNAATFNVVTFFLFNIAEETVNNFSVLLFLWPLNPLQHKSLNNFPTLST